MARPTAERPAKGLDAYWTHVWNHALSVMKADGTWGWELKPLLDEYVYALRAAEATRDGFAWLDALEAYAGVNAADMDPPDWGALAQMAAGLPTQWDRHTKRASLLATTLVLTPEARKKHGLTDADDEQPQSTLDALDNVTSIKRRA